LLASIHWKNLYCDSYSPYTQALYIARNERVQEVLLLRRERQSSQRASTAVPIYDACYTSTFKGWVMHEVQVKKVRMVTEHGRVEQDREDGLVFAV